MHKMSIAKILSGEKIILYATGIKDPKSFYCITPLMKQYLFIS